MNTYKPSFFALSETWLHDTPAYSSITAQCCPDKYTILQKSRNENARGGGVALICNIDLKPKIIDLKFFSTFEYICVKLNSNLPFIISVVYRPPNNNINCFLEEFTEFLTELSTFDKSLTILGDFNIHVNKNSNSIFEFFNIFDLFDLQQYVTEPTHNLGNTLDLVISSLKVKNVSISDLAISDDHLINFEYDIPIAKQTRELVTVTFRNLKDINFDNLNSDLLSILPSVKNSPLSQSLDFILTTLNNALSCVLDSHAPLVTRTVFSRPDTKFFPESTKLKEAKRFKRACERKKIKARNQNRNFQSAYSTYKSATKSYFKLFHLERGNSNTKNFTESKNKNKILFKQHKKLSAPPIVQLDNVITSDTFAKFFIEKIDKIRNNITPANCPIILPDSPPDKFTSFALVTEEEVRTIVSSSNKSYSPADSFPSKLILKILPTILPHLTSLINLSLRYGVFPQSLKHAFVKPLLKKPDLDPSSLQNYRPISQLTFFAKIIEKIATRQLVEHMSSFLTCETYQSGFKKFHSTETALLCVSNDLRRSSDNGYPSILIQLDCSAAFDTLDIPTLLKTLENFVGLGDSALSWFSSYLSNRSFQVQQSNDTSESTDTKHGVPQGSVPGPILYRVYIIPLLILLTRLGIKYHIYADDTQIYISCLSGNFRLTIETIQLIFLNISNWLSDN